MNYGFKITTHGRALLAACMDLGAALEITRVAVGSGRIGEDTDLADMRELVQYAAEGAVADRRREGDRLHLTVQYSNQDHPNIGTFQLAEFLVFARDPDTGRETDLLYATLGDYPQSIPAYSPRVPAGLWSFPLTIVVSSEIEVNVSASPGLVTYEDLADITEKLAIRYIGLTIPASGWVKDGSGRYPWRVDVPAIEATPLMIPFVTVMEQGEEATEDCGLAPRVETLEGAVRFRAVEPAAADIVTCVTMLRDSTGVVLAAPDTDGTPTMPIAAENTPGMVKPGRGLLVAEDGTLNLDMASDEEFEALFSAAGEGA